MAIETNQDDCPFDGVAPFPELPPLVHPNCRCRPDLSPTLTVDGVAIPLESVTLGGPTFANLEQARDDYYWQVLDPGLAFEPDSCPQFTIDSIAGLAGTFDLSGLGIALDAAEEHGVNVTSGRLALQALTLIRLTLAQTEDWPHDDPEHAEAVREMSGYGYGTELETAAKLLESRGVLERSLARCVRRAARAITGK